MVKKVLPNFSEYVEERPLTLTVSEKVWTVRSRAVRTLKFVALTINMIIIR